jgi:hypothetical protein
MVRDTTEGKIDYLNVRFGPMLKRWAAHCTKGREKYPDPAPGVPNWTLAEGEEEYQRFRESAARHFEQWLAGETDEDHAAATFFNMNGAEDVKERMDRDTSLAGGKDEQVGSFEDSLAMAAQRADTRKVILEVPPNYGWKLIAPGESEPC